MILKYTVISQAMEKNHAVIKHVNKFCPREIGIKWGSRNKKYMCQEERFGIFLSRFLVNLLHLFTEKASTITSMQTLEMIH